MFFFFDTKKLPVANVIKRGPLSTGAFSNIDCVNAEQGKKTVRLVSFNSFLTIVGISPRAKGVWNSFCQLLTHPSVRSQRSEAILDKLNNGYLVKDGSLEEVFIDYRVITDFCRLMLLLRRLHKIRGAYLDVAANCERFMLGLADVGLAAMIDEATGYDKIKKQHEYQELFKAYIRETQSDWVKEFPDEFFEQLYRVYRCEKKGRNHPSFFSYIIRKYIYWPLVDSHGAIWKKLDEKNPVISRTGRKFKLHQFLSEEIGKPALRAHLASVITLLVISADKGAFLRNFKKRYPKAGDQLEFDFDDL